MYYVKKEKVVIYGAISKVTVSIWMFQIKSIYRIHIADFQTFNYIEIAP